MVWTFSKNKREQSNKNSLHKKTAFWYKNASRQWLTWWDYSVERDLAQLNVKHWTRLACDRRKWGGVLDPTLSTKWIYAFCQCSVIKHIFWQKSYIMSSINNQNRFNIKLFFGPVTTLKRSPKGEILVFNKLCDTKTKFHIKIIKFVTTFEKLVLGS